eukprot:1159508-Pelagomonas_calceolata.AAC.5
MQCSMCSPETKSGHVLQELARVTGLGTTWLWSSFDHGALFIETTTIASGRLEVSFCLSRKPHREKCLGRGSAGSVKQDDLHCLYWDMCPWRQGLLQEGSCWQLQAYKLVTIGRANGNKNTPHSQVLELGASSNLQIPTSPSFSCFMVKGTYSSFGPIDSLGEGTEGQWIV